MYVCVVVVRGKLCNLHTMGQIPHEGSLHCSGSHSPSKGMWPPGFAPLTHICFGTPYNATPDKKVLRFWPNLPSCENQASA